jgi:hypothetical protein
MRPLVAYLLQLPNFRQFLAYLAQLPTFLSIAVLLWSVAMALRMVGTVSGRRLTWLAPAYLITQLLVVVIGWWGMQPDMVEGMRHDTIESRAYLFFFGIGFFLVLGFAVAFAVKLAFIHPKALGTWLICTAASFGGCLSTIVYLELRKIYGIHTIPPQCQMATIQGGVLLFCGAATLVALFTELSPELRYAVIALGTFWMLIGIFALGFAIGIIRNRGVWLHLNDFLPAFLAIVLFSWLAIQWGNLQAETSRQVVPVSVNKFVPAERV